MELLIHKNDVAYNFQISKGIDVKTFNTYIREAQELDFKKIVPVEFYFDLLSNHKTEIWSKLMNDNSYVYDGRTYHYSGLKKVLSYFTYARLLLKGNITSTAFGFTIKKNQHSEPVSIQEKRDHYHNYRKDANTIFEDLKLYLDRHTDLYPSWKGSCASTPSRRYNSRIIQ